MVQLVKNCNFLHDHIDIICKFDLVQYFYSNLESLIMLVLCFEHFTEGSSSENFCIIVDVIIHFQLTDTLLSTTLPCTYLLPRRNFWL